MTNLNLDSTHGNEGAACLGTYRKINRTYALNRPSMVPDHGKLGRCIAALTTVLFLTLGTPELLRSADMNVLIVGSTGDSRSTGNVSGTASAFNPTEVRTYLQNILAGAGVGTVNVVVENRGSPYDLAAWFHYPYPVDVETTTRWPNLRGESGTAWDYVVVIGDLGIMETMPGLYAQGVAMVAQEAAKGGAETVLLMPWSKSGSASVAHYKEVVYRAGRSGPYKVAPAALAWQAAGSPNSGAAHPTVDGAFIAAASIYSTIWNQSASASTYVYNDTMANAVHTEVTTNNSVSQYTGNFAFQNPFLMFGDKRRDVHFSEKGTSTENDFKGSVVAAMNRARVTSNHASYCVGGDNDYYNTYLPESDGLGWPSANPMPIAWNHGRKFTGESWKEYVTNPTYWQLGMGFMYQQNTWANTVADANDTHISQILSNDVYLANYMKGGPSIPNGQHSSARAMPWRLMWAQIHQQYPTLNPLRDGSGPHLNVDLHNAVGTYMYTLYSGRCPLDVQPNPITTRWYAQKVGYETAWRLGRCQTRAPGFKVLPSAATKKTIVGATTETMTVQFILPPQANVTVNISSSDTSRATVSPSTLTFTPANYSTAQSITVTAVSGLPSDLDFDVVFSTTSTDEVYNGLSDSWRYTAQSNLRTVAWSVASQISATESGTMTVTAQLSAASGSNVSVPFTLSGTATGADFTITPNPIVIAAGATTGTATITITADTLVEANETVILTMGTPTNATKGATTVHTATITDDDSAGLPIVTWTASSQASAGESGTMTVTAQLSAASGLSVNVPFTVSGTSSAGDRTLTASPITIAAGATTGTATITITADTLDEANETVILTMGSPTNATLGATTVHTAMITDDDATPTVTWTAASQASAGESGTMTVTAQLSAVSGQSVSVLFTVTGTALTGDRTVSASPITIAAGATTGMATITITADTLLEGNETVILTMDTPTNATKGATTVHTATITDDDSLSITTQPANQTSVLGQTATFSVVGIGTPAPTYQWRKAGVAISGATSASYTTPATVMADNGALFSVVVTNATGSITSSNATLTVTTASPAVSNNGTATPGLSGVTQPSATVHVFVNGVEVGTATVASDGTWSYTVSGLPNGTHNVTVTTQAGSLTTAASSPVSVTVNSGGGTTAGASSSGGGGGCGLGAFSSVLFLLLMTLYLRKP